MSTSTLTQEARQNVALFSQPDFHGTGVKMTAFARGGKKALRLENVPVFRSGTFRDSMGFQHTWEPLHMREMVMHYDELNARMNGVPVRKGHPSFLGNPIDDIIGWHTALRVEERTSPADGKEYTYLLADYEILEPSAVEKIESGLWRDLSSEVGSWTTNDEAEYWPVYTGVAYVDYSAVEGLVGFSKAGKAFSLIGEKEGLVPTKTTAAAAAGGENDDKNPPLPTFLYNGNPLELDKVQGKLDHAAALESKQPHAFTVAGREVNDYAKVQEHITELEEFRRMTLEGARKDFVNGLVESNKITAAQMEATEEFALGLTASQFEAWCKTWDAAPAAPLLQVHGKGDAPSAPPTGQVSQDEADFETAVATVNHLRRGGRVTDDRIKATPSYQKAKALAQKLNKQFD